MPITLRPWRDASDWAHIAAVRNAESAADGTQYVHTAGELAAERRPNMDPSRDVFLAEEDGRVVGVVAASWAIRDGRVALNTDGAVHPSHRRRGIGTALLRRAQEHLANATAAVEPERERRFDAWVGEVQGGAVALLERNGYAIDRYGFEMARSGLDALDGSAAPLVPDGIEIRAGSLPELRQTLVAEDEAFRDHPGHRDWTDADTEGVLANPCFDPTLWRVAWAGDEVAGAVENWVYPDENEALGLRRGWLERVSVRRPWRKRGLARALIEASFAALGERGLTHAMLGVDAKNPSGALRLYESMGFERVRTGLLYARPAPR